MTNETPVALITGAAQRIGSAISRTLHQQGYNIVIHYRNSNTAAEALATELNTLRKNSAICIQANFCDSAAITTLAEQVINHWGRLDVLINNASSFYPTPVGEINDTDWEQLMGSNAKAPLILCQASAKALAENNGCIINMIDIHADRPMKEYTVYCMAKASLAMMTKSLAKELAPDVRVNGIAPGAILWPQQDEALGDKAKQSILNKIPLAKTGAVDDITHTVSFLITSPYITGQIIAVDGGRSLSI